MSLTSPLVNCQWLNQHLNDDNLVVLDASMAKVVGKEAINYEQFVCIPGAKACDLERAFHLTGACQPHTMPSAEQFESQLTKLAINKNTTVVIYDNQGIYSAPRAWWMFKLMGFKQVYLLDGGLPAWLAQQLPTAHQYQLTPNNNDIDDKVIFNASKRPSAVLGSLDVLAAIDDSGSVTIDVRAKERFLGLVAEPRAGVRSGHIPKAINLPFAKMLSGHGFKTKEQLSKLFNDYNISPDKQLIFSCGSGITACIVLLGAYICGYDRLSLYDGSWSEWGSNPDLPISNE
jgi:thiosulfate/3-mercaptopyruvate sulfurtransferase